MKPVQNRETLPSSLNVFCWLWLLDQEAGSGPTSSKHSRKLNRLDDTVLFTVADREAFLVVRTSPLFPLILFCQELPHLLLRMEIICIWRDMISLLWFKKKKKTFLGKCLLWHWHRWKLDCLGCAQTVTDCDIKQFLQCSSACFLQDIRFSTFDFLLLCSSQGLHHGGQWTDRACQNLICWSSGGYCVTFIL